MANVFTKAEKISAVGLGLLNREVILGQLVTAYTESDFKGAKNDWLTIPIRARATANRRKLRETDPDKRKVKTNDLTESSVGIQLTEVTESGVSITDEQQTLDIKDFGEQVLQPQVLSVVEDIELFIYEMIHDAPYATNIDWDTEDTAVNAYNYAIMARKALNKANVPAAGRVLLVGSGAEALILNDSKLQPGNPEGLGQGALRDATIGRFAGFTVVTSNLLQDDEAYAFHRTAFGFGNVAPAIPKGAKGGSRRSSNGFSMRWIMDYDADQSTDRSLVTAWMGTASVNDGPTKSPAFYKGSATDPDNDDAPWAAIPTNVRAVKLTVS